MKKNKPGKYDAACTQVRELVNAAGVVLFVVGGSLGHGLTVQFPDDLVPRLPSVLRQMADSIEAETRANSDAQLEK
jgi:hypothetical protein